MFDASVSRPMWEAVERFHALAYIAPEVRDHGTAAGLKGFWMNYFATRTAPVGAVGAAGVQSTFFYFGPSRVGRAIPDAWSLSTPERVIVARYTAMDDAIRRVYGSDVDAPQVREAAEIVRQAVEGCEPIGRLLYAGWSSLEWPSEPHLALWHGCTLLREYRSGNHLIAVCDEGLGGCDSVVSHVAVGGAPRAWIRDEAGWTEADEADSVDRLKSRGWLDDSGNATVLCMTGRARLEAMTDRLDFPIWKQLGEAKGGRLFATLSKLAQKLPADDQLDWQVHYPGDAAESGSASQA